MEEIEFSKQLREDVLQANLMLPREKLAILTWGNVSGINTERTQIAIKASGVPYKNMTADHMVIVDMDGGAQTGYNPSTDLYTHLVIYKEFVCANAVVHIHSPYATMWAQAGKDIPCLGTTHSDYFYGTVPCTRKMTPAEIGTDYELHTGRVIVDTFQKKGIDPARVSAVLVHSHGPFVWGVSPAEAVKNAIVLEYIAKMAYLNTTMENGGVLPVQQELLDKHYNRKFGTDAYYGQE